jgi:hypothetical protein
MRFEITSGHQYSIGFNAGSWGTDSYRSFGLNGTSGDKPMVNVTQGKTSLGDKYLQGNLSVKKDNWYSFAIAIGKNGEIFAMIWDLSAPSHKAIYHETLSEKWTGLSWQYVINSNAGTVLSVDNFSYFSFSAVK